VRIALLEDDPHLVALFTQWLREAGHHITVFLSGHALLDTLRQETFDLLVLDWVVPDIHGKDVLAWVRKHLDWPIPVIFVTQRDEEDDVVGILLQGADDYLVKPVGHKEMIARLTALARRSQLRNTNNRVIQHKPYCINTATKTITRDGETVKLTQKEFDLVLFLFQNTGRVLSRNHILENVWGHKPGINTRTVDTHISRLRNKLGLAPENGWKLSGVYHHGYRLEQLDTEENNN
jgi:two-component system response regulator RegX3